MQAHLAAQDDYIWSVITDGPVKITKINIAFATTDGAPEYVEKRRHEYTNEEKKKANLDNVARDILYKTLDKNMFSKIKTCATIKEIWEKLIQICEGNDETKENKITVAQQKYKSIKMREGETMSEFDERFSAVVIELTSLGKEYSNRELALKVMRALPREWDVKTVAMREYKDLNKLELHDLLQILKLTSLNWRPDLRHRQLHNQPRLLPQHLNCVLQTRSNLQNNSVMMQCPSSLRSLGNS
ncbi:hypothetical protein F511_09840 [Dorcoceras hygrometricum]|uniref:Uncharacterized protein n=1 Tax=Dorcoceras hygrometricum TaxID=472368 RepID=A0A2Z7C8M4_9LAMI|nr:hypothetical protein F511_09840 [Dorcoceras hygrometricum]